MHKTVLRILVSAAISASALQNGAAAAERHHVRQVDRTAVSASEKFNNANNAIARPAESNRYSGYYSGGMSAPAGQ